MRVACVQLAARDVEDAEEALEAALAATDAAAADADLVVLPEAVYPGYVLHDPAPFARGAAAFDRAVGAFGSIATAREAWIAVGLVRPVEGALRNSAVLVAPGGEIAGVADKTFLWHFDTRWFRAGTPGEVAVLPWGPLGMLVCADLRMPELPRRLAAAGARLLVDCTALVLPASGRNAQVEYMLEARARENGAFLAVANRCGVEAGIARYAGRSAILDPSGRRIVEAGPDEPATIVASVDLAAAPGPAAPVDGTDLGDGAGVAALLAAPPPAAPLRIAVARAGARDPGRARRELAADLLLSPGAAGEGLSRSDGRWSHEGRALASGDAVDVAGTRIGVLDGDAGEAPEPARRLMLDGATVIAWAAGSDDVEAVARTRADENRVFVLVLLPGGRWLAVAPSGAVLASGPDPDLDATLVELPLALAWNKAMAPGSDVVADRPAPA
jgi:predicted amidohydrolase